jgi:hypothetical protein
VRILLKVSAATVVLSGLIYALHLPAAHDVLARFGGCPFPFTNRTLPKAAAETLRFTTLQKTRGAQPIATREAAGFALTIEKRRDVMFWAKEHKLDCRADRHGAGLTCAHVKGDMLPSPRAANTTIRVLFGFDAADVLVGVQLQSVAKNASKACAHVASAQQAIVRLGGAPLSGVERLGEPLAQAKTMLRASNYSADVVISNIANTYAIYESYQAL